MRAHPQGVPVHCPASIAANWTGPPSRWTRRTAISPSSPARTSIPLTSTSGTTAHVHAPCTSTSARRRAVLVPAMPTPPPTGGPSAPPRQRQRQQQQAADPNLELIQALLTASNNELLQSLSSAEQLLRSAAARIQRLVEPPPSGFPPGPSGDQAVTLLLDPLQFLRRTTSEYGSVVGLLLGTERVVLVTDKALARQVMIDQADVFIKEGTAFFPGSALAGNGLLVSDGEVWRRQRRLSNPSFRRSAIDGYASAMVSSTQGMMERRWRPGQVRDLYSDFNTLTLEVTLEALFGFRILPQAGAAAGGQPRSSSGRRGRSVEEQQAGKIVAAVEKAFEFFSRRAGSAFTLPEWVPTLDNLEFGLAVQQLDEGREGGGRAAAQQGRREYGSKV